MHDFQSIAALVIVLGTVGFVIYRVFAQSKGSCSGCDCSSRIQKIASTKQKINSKK